MSRLAVEVIPQSFAKSGRLGDMASLPAYTNGRWRSGFRQSLGYIREMSDEAAICFLADRTCCGLGGQPAGRNNAQQLATNWKFAARGDRVSREG